MRKKGGSKLKQIANERGVTPRELVLLAIAEYGSEFKAAVALDVYPNTLRWYRTQHTKASRDR